MADAYSALNAFQQGVLENNVWRQLAQPVLAQQFDRSTWSPAESFGVSAGQAFLGAALDSIGRNQASKQMMLATSALPSLYANPIGAQAPAGIDLGAWSGLKAASIRDSYLESLSRDQETRQFSNQILRDVFAANPELAIRASGLGGVMKDPSLVAEQGKKPKLTDLGPDFGVPTVEEEYDRIYREARARGERHQQASIVAREGSEYMRKRSKDLFGDMLKSNQETIENVEEMIRKGEEGVAKAGITGAPGSSTYESLAALLPWASEAKEQAAGDRLLEVTQNLAASINRIKGSGALSDFESRALFRTGMSPSATVEQNAALLRNYKVGLAQMKEHNAFLNYFLDKTGGNPTMAQQMWDLYKAENPIVVQDEQGNNILNEARSPWQKFDFQSAYTNFITGGGADMQSFIADAKARGLTKEQARAEWAARGM